MTKTKRTAADKLISTAMSIRYAITEPLLLRLARMRNCHSYRNSDESPLVSVDIPTYNRAEILMERAVKTVLAQTYNNFELIIVGDHCTDRTEELVKTITDPRIRLYNIQKRGYRYPPTAENHWFAGPVVAANTALSMVRGKWIARIDDDDIWTPDHLETLLRFAQKGDYEFVSANYVEERRGVQAVGLAVSALDPYYTRKSAPNDSLHSKIGGTQTWLYRSYLKLFRYNINCWRKNWNKVNDIDISLRIFNAGVRMGFIEQIVAYILPRPGEETVGLEAYTLNEKDKLEHYRFNL